MTSTALALPRTGDPNEWTDQEKALVEAAGLVRTEGRGDGARRIPADRPTVEAFLAHCHRTQLDPIARQIYAIYRGGKWGIQISIDGARLVAQRTGKYRGQTTPEFTGDGVTWTQVWLADEPPKAARVGVLHEDFREPMYAVALWEAYAVYDDVWENGRKTGVKRLSSMWSKMGPLMLAKCAEMLALRKAFPQDLSGLYSTEEMAQAGGAPVEREAQPAEVGIGYGGDAVESHPGAVIRNQRAQAARVAAPVEEIVVRDWAAEIAAVSDLATLTALANEAQQGGHFGDEVGETAAGAVLTVRDALWARKAELEQVTPPLVDAKPAKARARDWVREARALDAGQLRALIVEASAAGAADAVLEQMEDLYRSLPVEPPEGDAAWAATAEDDRWQGTPAALDGEMVVDDDEVI